MKIFFIKNKYEFIGIILLFLFLSSLFFINLPFFPHDYSKIEFLFKILNLIIGGGFLFGIYKWKIDRYFKEQTDFIKNFDDIYLKVRKLLKEDNLVYLTKAGYTPYLIENFIKLNINNGFINCKFNNNDSLLSFNMMNNYKKIINNIEITEALLDLHDLINFLNINSRIIDKNIEIKEYIKLKLNLFRNIDFFGGLLIIHLIYSKITLTELSFDKNKKYLIINNNILLEYINGFYLISEAVLNKYL